jgi:hypothetical protein
LLTVIFLPWYRIDGAHITAWDELKPGRYALVATAVVGLLPPTSASSSALSQHCS